MDFEKEIKQQTRQRSGQHVRKTSRESSARRRERTEKLRKYNCICELQESVQLVTIMLPVWEATLDEIEGKLLE